MKFEDERVIAREEERELAVEGAEAAEDTARDDDEAACAVSRFEFELAEGEVAGKIED